MCCYGSILFFGRINPGSEFVNLKLLFSLAFICWRGVCARGWARVKRRPPGFHKNWSETAAYLIICAKRAFSSSLRAAPRLHLVQNYKLKQLSYLDFCLAESNVLELCQKICPFWFNSHSVGKLPTAGKCGGYSQHYCKEKMWPCQLACYQLASCIIWLEFSEDTEY